jgi:hypothetical protein
MGHAPLVRFRQHKQFLKLRRQDALELQRVPRWEAEETCEGLGRQRVLGVVVGQGEEDCGRLLALREEASRTET